MTPTRHLQTIEVPLAGTEQAGFGPGKPAVAQFDSGLAGESRRAADSGNLSVLTGYDPSTPVTWKRTVVEIPSDPAFTFAFAMPDAGIAASSR